MKTSINSSIFAVKCIAAGAAIACTNAAFAHIVLETRSAEAGSTYKAVFQVAHGCAGSPTTALRVEIPAGFQAAKPYAKAGWGVAMQKAKLAIPYESHGKQVTEDVSEITWKTEGKPLPNELFDEFTLRGKLPANPGPMWFKVLQTCENGSNNWADIPTSGINTSDLKMPAALLQIAAAGSDMAANSAISKAPAAPTVQLATGPVRIANGWVRATVPGQKGTGAFMTLTAAAGTRLVGVQSGVAGVAEVHEMAMEGNVMRMRAVKGLDLPAGKPVELKPGGFHLMLMDLKQTLATGSTIPVTLLLQNAKGAKSQVEVTLPVSLTAPGKDGKAAASAGEMDHSKH